MAVNDHPAGPLQVIIAGGGIAGLTAAIALRRAGHDVHVHERAPQLSAVGAGITLWPNAIKALRTLDLAEAVIAAGTRVGSASILTSNGRLLGRSDLSSLEEKVGEPTIAIHRADLLAVLRKDLEQSAISLASEFLSYDETGLGVLVRFADGSSRSSDILVGADGIHSAVRGQLLPGVSLRDSGYAAWRGVVGEGGIQRSTSESWGCGSRFGIVPLGNNRTYWFATINTAPTTIDDPMKRKAAMEAAFAGWHEPIPAIVRATDPRSILYNHIFDAEPLPRWHSRRVILIGDAVHPTTPNMGQGGGMAIESAVVLGRCLSEKLPVSDAFEEFVRRRKQRTAWITGQSWRIGRLGQIGNPVLCGLRNGIIRATPRSMMDKQLMTAATFSI